VPLLVLQLGLLVWPLVDLIRPGRQVRGGNKAAWAGVMAFVSLVGPLL
jgi:hypothetical protein